MREALTGKGYDQESLSQIATYNNVNMSRRFRSCPPGGPPGALLLPSAPPLLGASRGPPKGPLTSCLICPPGGLLGGLPGPQSSLGVLTCGGKNEIEVYKNVGGVSRLRVEAQSASGCGS